MPYNIRLVWYRSDSTCSIIGRIDVKPDGSFTGQIDDDAVKRMINDDLMLDMGFTARAAVPATSEPVTREE